MTKHTVDLTEKNFNEIALKSDKPVLVDFWASWCGPCRSIAPLLEEIAEEHKDNLIVAKVNVDEEPNLAESCEIQGIPALMRFENGEMVGLKVGGLSKNEILEFLGLA